MNGRRGSFYFNRRPFMIGAIVTAILLVVSLLPSRIVFRAQQVSSAVYIEPSSARLATGQQQSFRILAAPNGELNLSAVQFELSFQSEHLRLVSFESGNFWRLAYKNERADTLSVALLPSSGQPILKVTDETLYLGTVKFEALTAGSVALSFAPRSLILAAVDLDRGGIIYNAASSSQTASLFISNERVSSEDGVIEISDDPTELERRSLADRQGQAITLQRIISEEPVSLPSALLLLVKLRYGAKLRVEFGPTSAFGTVVEEFAVNDSHAVFIHGLLPNTKYYYQVTAVDANGLSQVKGSLKNFTTPRLSANEPNVQKSDFIIFPQKIADRASVYIVLRDNDGNVVSSQEPSLSVDYGEVEVGKLTKVADSFQAILSTKDGSRQFAQITASVLGQSIDKKSVLFDPMYKPSSRSSETLMFRVEYNQRTIATLIGLIVVLLLSGLIAVQALQRN